MRLKEELREPRNSRAMFRAVAPGNRRVGEIVRETGLAKTVLHKYRQVPEEVQVARREVPATEEARRRSKGPRYGIQAPTSPSGSSGAIPS